MFYDAYALRAAFIADPQCTSSSTWSMTLSARPLAGSKCKHALYLYTVYLLRVCVHSTNTHSHTHMPICVVPHLYLRVFSRFSTFFIGFFSDSPRFCQCVCVLYLCMCPCLCMCVCVSVTLCLYMDNAVCLCRAKLKIPSSIDSLRLLFIEYNTVSSSCR